MTQRERFETWLKSKYGDMFEPIGEDPSDTAARLVKLVAWQSFQDTETATLDRAWEAVHAERLQDSTEEHDDLAYQRAVVDCEHAVRALMAEKTEVKT